MNAGRQSRNANKWYVSVVVFFGMLAILLLSSVTRSDTARAQSSSTGKGPGTGSQPQVTPSPTGIWQCNVQVQTATASCELPFLYSYSFTLTQPICVPVEAWVRLQVAETIDGQWTTIREQHYPRSNAPVVEGSFREEIPEQYNFYRISFAGVAYWGFSRETEPAPICRGTPICPTSWTEKADYPSIIKGEIVAVQGNKVYSFGGISDAGLEASAYVYDPATNTWESIAPLPEPRISGSAFSDGTYIYIVNGEDGTGGPANTILRYDPATDTYFTLPQHGLVPTLYEAVIELDGVIYRIGGLSVNTSIDSVEVYGDHYVSPLPKALNGLSAVAMNGYIYAGGGMDAQGNLNKQVYRFDPATGIWASNVVADMPTTSYEAASGILDGKWIIAGGTGEIKKDAIAYNFATNTWEFLTLLPQGVEYVGGAATTDAFYVVGGWIVNGPSDNSVIEYRFCNSQTPTVTPTSAPTNIATVTATPTTSITPTATVCNTTFTDVEVGSTFYPYVQCLACKGILNGYPDGTFRPNNNVTRGQLAKIVANSAGFEDTVSGQTFEDVLPGSTFYEFIERLIEHGVMNGYACGGAGEPCVEPGNRPYFRPNSVTTRGQAAKVISNAAGFNDTVAGQMFEDVPEGSTFYEFVQRLVSREIMTGYPCGGAGEPCVAPLNRLYFRPGNLATRGQAAKIISNTFFSDCGTR